MKTREEIEALIEERERNGARATFTCGTQALTDLSNLNQIHGQAILTPPINEDAPWRLMGRDLHIVEGRQGLKVVQ